MDFNGEVRQFPLDRTIIEKGDFLDKPEIGSECVIQLLIINGGDDQCESDYLKTGSCVPVKIWEGDTVVDRQIDSCLRLMNRGETSVFTLTSPSCNSGVRVQIKLVSFSSCVPFHHQDTSTKLESAQRHKAEGSKLYAAGRIVDAFHRFSRGLKFLISIHEPEDHFEKEYNAALINLNNNIAQCHLVHKNYDEVIEVSNVVLDVDPRNVKALFRKGCAHLELQNYETAKEIFNKALNVDSNNQAIINQLRSVTEKQKVLNNYYKKQMGKLFN